MLLPAQRTPPNARALSPTFCFVSPKRSAGSEMLGCIEEGLSPPYLSEPRVRVQSVSHAIPQISPITQPSHPSFQPQPSPRGPESGWSQAGKAVFL